MRRPATLILLLAEAAFSQAIAPSSATFHVRGAVIDTTTRQPIPNVRVQMVGGPSALTSANGNYDIPVTQPGSYDLKIEAQGYRPEMDPYNAVLSGQSDSVTVDMQMYRPGAITGRLVDAGTKQPVVGLRVIASRVTYRLGRALPGTAAGGSVTNPQGTFRVEQLLPGAYSLGFAASIDERVLNSDTPPAREPAIGYRRQRWPVAGNALELRAGGEIDVGDILIAREPLYRITGVLTGCPNGDDFSRGLQVYEAGGAQIRSGAAAVACGERFYIENLAPGEYVLQ